MAQNGQKQQKKRFLAKTGLERRLFVTFPNFLRSKAKNGLFQSIFHGRAPIC
jgi:hypothetical protein